MDQSIDQSVFCLGPPGDCLTTRVEVNEVDQSAMVLVFVVVDVVVERIVEAYRTLSGHEPKFPF